MVEFKSWLRAIPLYVDQALRCRHKNLDVEMDMHCFVFIAFHPSIIGSVPIYSDASLHTHVDIFIPSLSLGCWRDVQAILLWLILCIRHFFQQVGFGSSVISTTLGRPRSTRINLSILSVTPFVAFLMSATWLIGIRIIDRSNVWQVKCCWLLTAWVAKEWTDRENCQLQILTLRWT